MWSKPIFTLFFLEELVVRASSSIVYVSLQWWICWFFCQLLLLCYSISLIELINKLICSDSEGLFLSQITRKILYASTVFSVSPSYISLCHIFHFFLINREASSPPADKTITAGIFCKRKHLSHLFTFFIFMSSFWLHPHNSYCNLLRCTLKAMWQKGPCISSLVFVFPLTTLNYLIWSLQLTLKI